MSRRAPLVKTTVTWTAEQKAWLAAQAVRSGLASEAAVARSLVQQAMDADQAEATEQTAELAQAS